MLPILFVTLLNRLDSRPVRRILKRGVQSTAWPLGHGEGEGMRGGCAPSCAKREAFTLDDLECQSFIQIYREKITETLDLSSPSFLDASVKPFYKHYLYQFQSNS